MCFGSVSLCLCVCVFSLKVELKETTIRYAAVLELCCFKVVVVVELFSSSVFCAPHCILSLVVAFVVVISILQKAVPVLIFCCCLLLLSLKFVKLERRANDDEVCQTVRVLLQFCFCLFFFLLFCLVVLLLLRSKVEG